MKVPSSEEMRHGSVASKRDSPKRWRLESRARASMEQPGKSSMPPIADPSVTPCAGRGGWRAVYGDLIQPMFRASALSTRTSPVPRHAPLPRCRVCFAARGGSATLAFLQRRGTGRADAGEVGAAASATNPSELAELADHVRAARSLAVRRRRQRILRGARRARGELCAGAAEPVRASHA